MILIQNMITDTFSQSALMVTYEYSVIILLDKITCAGNKDYSTALHEDSLMLLKNLVTVSD